MSSSTAWWSVMFKAESFVLIVIIIINIIINSLSYLFLVTRFMAGLFLIHVTLIFVSFIVELFCDRDDPGYVYSCGLLNLRYLDK